MNIYKNLLFLHGYLLDPKLANDDFGPTYGNRVATEKLLRDRWETERDQREINPPAGRINVADALGCG
jgi:hypothetical protein